MVPTAAAETCDRTGTCGPDTRRYEVAVRCNAAAVKDAETGDTLTVTAWSGYSGVRFDVATKTWSPIR
jgi:hypothetical protein